MKVEIPEDLDLPTKIRYVEHLLKVNGQEIELDKRFKNRRKRNKLLNQRKKLRVIRDLVINEAREEQYWLVNVKLLQDRKQRYRYECRFDIPLRELAKIKGYSLLVKYGYYDPETNPNGVVKDHRFSVIEGFESKEPTEIVGHIANCEFLTYSDNAKKGRVSSLTKEQLHEEIRKWS